MDFINNATLYKNQLWRFVLTVFCSLIFLIIFAIIALFVCFATGIDLPAKDDIVLLVEQNAIYNLTTFVISLIAFLINFKAIHNGKIWHLINTTSHFRANRIGFTFTIYCILFVISIISSILDPDTKFVLCLRDFIPYFFTCAFLLIFQTLFEEIIVRSYFFQFCGLYCKKRWIIVTLSSILFAYLHIENTPVQNNITYLIVYFVSGMVWGIITILDNGIELSWSCHFFNNIIACSLLSDPTSDFSNVPTIFRCDTTNENQIIIGIIVSCIIDFGILLACCKKYNWTLSDILVKLNLK